MSNFDDRDHIKEMNNAYWAEEEELKAGVHPTQVMERIKNCLDKLGVKYNEITYLDWNVEGTRVKVSLDNAIYGIFDYTENCFEE